jgi:hypothetical protein
MRNNRATRLNRAMMYAIALMGILILVCTYTFVYLALPDEEVQDPEAVTQIDGIVTDTIRGLAP